MPRKGRRTYGNATDQVQTTSSAEGFELLPSRQIALTALGHRPEMSYRIGIVLFRNLRHASMPEITKGIKEIHDIGQPELNRQRRKGGRKSLETLHPEVVAAVEA